MPSWKKIAFSGSSPEFSSLNVDTSISASSLTGSLSIPSNSTLGIGAQTIFPQGNDGFSVNENFNVGNSTQTAYHFTSGDVNRTSVVFSLARTTQFTNMFGVTGSNTNNKFVFGSEFANTDFEWRSGLGVAPVRLQGGTLLARLTRSGSFYAPSISGSLTGSITGDLTGTASYAITASHAEFADNTRNAVSSSYAVTASYAVSASVEIIKEVSSSYADTASIALSGDGLFSGSFSGSFEGDGSNLTGITVTQVATAEDTFTSVTSYTASHGFDTKNVFVNIYDNNDELLLPATLKTLDSSSVAFTFDTSTSGRVVIGKAGHIVQAENLLAYRTGLSGSTTYNVTHSLDVEFPLVQTYLASTKEQIIPSKIKSLSVNAVQVEFDTTFSGSIVVKK